MSLEKSVLTPDLITKLAGKKYGLEIRAVERLKLGSANCYCISDDKNRYFLKEFQSGFSKGDLTREARLTGPPALFAPAPEPPFSSTGAI